jgi:hypothetical protein
MGIVTLFHHQGSSGARHYQRLIRSPLRVELVVGLLAAAAIVAFGIVAYFAFAPSAVAP